MIQLKLFNAKHYHDKNAKATWLKSESFDSDIFEKFKSLKSSLNNKRKKYIVINGKVLYLFYASAKENLGNRESNPISAFISDIDSPYSDKIYNAIDEQVKNKFNSSQREYIIKIDENILAIKKSFNFSLIFMIIVICMSCLAYLLYNEKDTKSKITVVQTIPEVNNFEKKKKSHESKLHAITKVQKSTKKDNAKKIAVSQVPIWKWKSFCTRYSKNEKLDNLVLNYIKTKCNGKEKFTNSFEEYLDGNNVNIEYLLHSFNRKEKYFFGEINEI